MKKKLFISINTSWNVYNFRRQLIKFLQDNGFEVIVAAPKDDYSQKVKSLGVQFYELDFSPKGSNPIEDLLLLRQYKKILAEVNPDICLFYTIKPNIYGSLAAKSLKIPFINTISGLGTTFIRENFVSKVAKALYKKALRHSSLIFFQNSEDKNLFVKKGIISDGKGQIVPGSGIDTMYFSKKSEKERGLPFTFLMISRLIFDKGIREYVEAVKLFKKDINGVQFQVLGRAEKDAGLGYSKKEFQKIGKEAGISWYEETVDVRPFIEASDVVVLPSYREGLSRALLEAGSMQKPIITTDVAGCRELVSSDENGLLCMPRNASDLAEKMKEMYYKSPEKLKQMGQKGREMVTKRYSQKIIFETYLNAITDKLS